MSDIGKFPSAFEPWYVVFKDEDLGKTMYFTDMETVESDKVFVATKGLARVFTNIRDAARVASAEGALIRVLVSQDDAKEFGRDGQGTD